CSVCTPLSPLPSICFLHPPATPEIYTLSLHDALPIYPMRVFAAGSLSNEMRIEVRWRNGRRSVVNGVKANRIYEIAEAGAEPARDRKSTRLNSSHVAISYAVFCLKKKKARSPQAAHAH